MLDPNAAVGACQSMVNGASPAPIWAGDDPCPGWREVSLPTHRVYLAVKNALLALFTPDTRSDPQ